MSRGKLGQTRIEKSDAVYENINLMGGRVTWQTDAL